MSLRLLDDSAQPHASGPIVIGASLDMIEQSQPGWSKALRAALMEHGFHLQMAELPELLKPSSNLEVSNTPAIIAIGPNDPDRYISQIMDMLMQTHAPALVLMDTKHLRIQAFMQAEGIMCEPFATSPQDAAMILRTLAQRQPALQRINSDLKLNEMTVNGVQSEVNRLHEELQSAASIQREYLPKGTPDIHGVDLGIIYRPASYVSGDIYDIAQLDENRSAFFLADAVGHGVPAALMTMVITQGLRKIDGSGADATVVEPAEALRRLNNTMTTHAGDMARFATAMYAIYDKSTNEVTIAGAGHPPALVIRNADQSTEMIDSQGPLLGIFSDVEFEQTTIKLDPGDVLVFYSDGFEVAFPNNQDDEHERKRPTLTYIARLSAAGNDDCSLDDSVRTLEENLDHQLGSLHQPDDITALFIAPTAQRSPATEQLINDLNNERPLPQ